MRQDKKYEFDSNFVLLTLQSVLVILANNPYCLTVLSLSFQNQNRIPLVISCQYPSVKDHLILNEH